MLYETYIKSKLLGKAAASALLYLNMKRFDPYNCILNVICVHIVRVKKNIKSWVWFQSFLRTILYNNKVISYKHTNYYADVAYLLIPLWNCSTTSLILLRMQTSIFGSSRKHRSVYVYSSPGPSAEKETIYTL